MKHAARCATIVVATLAAAASMVALTPARSEPFTPSQLAVTATDSTPGEREPFRLFGAVKSRGNRVPATIRVKTFRNGEWVKLPGAVTHTNRDNRFRVRIALGMEGERLLRVIGDPDRSNVATARRTITVTVFQDKFAHFLDEARPIRKGVIGADFSLEDVEYTSRKDAAADFYSCRKHYKDVCTTAILTTHDNWAHAAGLTIPDTLADLVSYAPLGHGAVAIKAVDQLSSPHFISYPPFVLYPDGRVKLLRIARKPRALHPGSVLLVDTGDFYGHTGMTNGIWAADVWAAETYRLPHSRGRSLSYATGRQGTLLSVNGYYKEIGVGVWRFEQSNDNARTWRTTDVRLPLGGKAIYNYTMDYTYAVGPRHLQAIAMTREGADPPRYLWELWLTTDEKVFRRVPLPRTPTKLVVPPKDFGGLVFASDGALLLGEATGHRIWRLLPGETDMKQLQDAPRLSEPSHWTTLYNSGGGMIVARTGPRAIALSTDGYTWTQVTPGR